jgi:hypothetical protein
MNTWTLRVNALALAVTTYSRAEVVAAGRQGTKHPAAGIADEARIGE